MKTKIRVLFLLPKTGLELHLRLMTFSLSQEVGCKTATGCEKGGVGPSPAAPVYLHASRQAASSLWTPTRSATNKGMEETIQYSEVKLQGSLSKTSAKMNSYDLKAGLASDGRRASRGGLGEFLCQQGHWQFFISMNTHDTPPIKNPCLLLYLDCLVNCFVP